MVRCLGIQTVMNDRYFRGPDWSNDRTEAGSAWWYYPYHGLQYIYDQMEYRYIDYSADDKLVYKDRLRDKSRKRYRGYVIPWYSVTDPFGDEVDLFSRTSWSGNLEVEQLLPISPESVEYIYSVRLRTDSWTKTVLFRYASLWWTYFDIRTYTIDTTWRRYSIVHSSADWGWGIKFSIQVDGNVYISRPVVYRQTDTNLEDVGTLMEIKYNNVKLIKARQDALKYSWAKVKRIPSMYPITFEPDITNTPDHYLIEEKHLFYINKSINYDEIANSIKVEYDWGTTSSITDATSIDEYRERELIVHASDLTNEGSASNYWDVVLSSSKDPNPYVRALVTRAYPIWTLRVWDLVQINGNSLSIERWYITRLDMSEESCTIHIWYYDSLGKSLFWQT
jgi:hypothetical protein